MGSPSDRRRRPLARHRERSARHRAPRGTRRDRQRWYAVSENASTDTGRTIGTDADERNTTDSAEQDMDSDS